MEPLFYVTAIMGCSDGSTNCAEARVEPARYRSVQACEAAMPAALMRNSDLSFPVIKRRLQIDRLFDRRSPPGPATHHRLGV